MSVERFGDWDKVKARLERWAESLQQNQIAVAIFPVPDDSGIVEEAEELAATLDAKLDPEQE